MDFKGDRLNEGKRENPFSVPEGYFDKLPLEIHNRISKGNESGSRSFSLIGLIKHQVGISLGVLFFVGVAYSGYRYNKMSEDSMIQPNDYFEFVSSNTGDFSEQDLIKALTSEKKEVSKKAQKRESDKIIEYLVDEQLETSAIEALYKDQQNELN